MKKIITLAVGLLLMLGLSFPTAGIHAANGTTYYVDNTNSACSDFGSGTISIPFCTISKGANLALPGDTVRVLAGSYPEKVRPSYNGTAGNPVTFSAAPNVTVSGDGSASGSAFRLTGWSYITVDGFHVTGTSQEGIYVASADHITITNNHVSYAGNPDKLAVPPNSSCGIYLSGTTNSTISGNTTDHNSLDGIRLVSTSMNNIVSNNVSFANSAVVSRSAEGIDVETNSTSNTIIHNIVYANEDSGLNFYTSSGNNLVIGNVSYGNGDHGIDNHDSPNNTIIGNTVQGNVTAGINLEGAVAPGSGGATIMNNIVVDNGYRRQVGGGTTGGTPGNIQVDTLSISGTTLDYNLYNLTSAGTQVVWAGVYFASPSAFHVAVPAQETHWLDDNPLFTAPAPIAQRPAAAPWTVDENEGDYHINAGSPAIDSANSSAPNEPATDIEGNARVDDLSVTNTGAGTRLYDDRGAYEYQTSLYTLTVTSLHGTVTRNPDKSAYAYNEEVLLTVQPDPGWSFVVWSGDATGAGNPVSVMMNGNKSVTATYALLTYTLTIVTNHGRVIASIPAPYHYGDVVQLTAVPDVGWAFHDWSGGVTSTSNPVDVTITGNMSVTANYQVGHTLFLPLIMR